MRHCKECQKMLLGRSDKKFCDDGCRNSFNNRKNSENNRFVKSINTVLRKNRNILHSLVPDNGKTSVNERTLKVLGFDFEHFTNVFENRTGNIYKFCYEYGYLKIDEGIYVLVKNHRG